MLLLFPAAVGGDEAKSESADEGGAEGEGRTPVSEADVRLEVDGGVEDGKDSSCSFGSNRNDGSKSLTCEVSGSGADDTSIDNSALAREHDFSFVLKKKVRSDASFQTLAPSLVSRRLSTFSDDGGCLSSKESSTCSGLSTTHIALYAQP